MAGPSPSCCQRAPSARPCPRPSPTAPQSPPVSACPCAAAHAACMGIFPREKESAISLRQQPASACCERTGRGPPRILPPLDFSRGWDRAHATRTSAARMVGASPAGGDRWLPGYRPISAFRPSKTMVSQPKSQIVKSHFRCRPILLLDEDPTLELKTLVCGG